MWAVKDTFDKAVTIFNTFTITFQSVVKTDVATGFLCDRIFFQQVCGWLYLIYGSRFPPLSIAITCTTSVRHAFLLSKLITHLFHINARIICIIGSDAGNQAEILGIAMEKKVFDAMWETTRHVTQLVRICYRRCRWLCFEFILRNSFIPSIIIHSFSHYKMLNAVHCNIKDVHFIGVIKIRKMFIQIL